LARGLIASQIRLGRWIDARLRDRQTLDAAILNAVTGLSSQWPAGWQEPPGTDDQHKIE